MHRSSLLIALASLALIAPLKADTLGPLTLDDIKRDDFNPATWRKERAAAWHAAQAVADEPATIEGVIAWPASTWNVAEGEAVITPVIHVLPAPAPQAAPVHEVTLADAPRLMFEVLGTSGNAVAWTFTALMIAMPFAATMAATFFAWHQGYARGWKMGEELDELRARQAADDAEKSDLEQPQLFPTAPRAV
jgi:hypothetical protein